MAVPEGESSLLWQVCTTKHRRLEHTTNISDRKEVLSRAINLDTVFAPHISFAHATKEPCFIIQTYKQDRALT